MRGMIIAALAAALAAQPTAASEVRHFKTQGRDAFLKGTLEGVSVDPLGRLHLAESAVRLATIEEPYVFSAARHPDGWVLGTGTAGRVLLVGEDGAVRTLFEAPEPQIFAVWVDPKGTVFAGSSPEGKVYRVTEDGGEVFYDPTETYIWAIDRDTDGRLLVATGTEGRLHRVGEDGRGDVFYDSSETHIRSLVALDDGGALIGTADDGLILRLAPDGTARALYDADMPEVVALAEGPGGDFYAALVDSEATLVERPSPASAAGSGGSGGDEAGSDSDAAPTGVVTVSGGGNGEPKPPAARGKPAKVRSEIVRLSAGGYVESLWRFSDETVYSLLWQQKRLWIGTGQEGKIFSWSAGELVLERDLEERQAVALLAGAGGPVYVTTNGGALYRGSGKSESEGTYFGAVLDAEHIARFGALHWDGETPEGTAVSFQLRSGISSEPDATWSDWRETSIAPPLGRYVQWRADLEAADGVSPVVTEVELAYRQENLRPRIESLEVLDPGQVLVPANFNPANQVYEPASPSRDGIFTTLGPARIDNPRTKTLWKRGYRSFTWAAEDPNGDRLRFALHFRKEGSDRWLLAAEDLDEQYYSFDATVLPDGVYRFRLTASDGPGNGNGDGTSLSGERSSEPVVIDHTPPQVVAVERREDRIEVTVRDRASPLREAVLSVDADDWVAAEVRDGLLDGRDEIIEVEMPDRASMLLLRLTDAAFNQVTIDLSDELP